jgi:hypothetical protein
MTAPVAVRSRPSDGARALAPMDDLAAADPAAGSRLPELPGRSSSPGIAPARNAIEECLRGRT